MRQNSKILRFPPESRKKRSSGGSSGRINSKILKFPPESRKKRSSSISSGRMSVADGMDELNYEYNDYNNADYLAEILDKDEDEVDNVFGHINLR